MNIADKEALVLDWIVGREDGGTVDEFICETGRYINSWAPMFTKLKKDKLIESIGFRETSHGSQANVWGLTGAGYEALEPTTELPVSSSSGVVVETLFSLGPGTYS